MVTRVKAEQTRRGLQAMRRRATLHGGRSGAMRCAGVLGLHGERMSKVDTAWLRMDTASNLMMIVGVWVLKPGIRYQDLRQRVQERLLKYPRFVQCAVEDAAGASWAADQRLIWTTT
jgi:diacylglycerol O-acyltransferase